MVRSWKLLGALLHDQICKPHVVKMADFGNLVARACVGVPVSISVEIIGYGYSLTSIDHWGGQ